MAVGGGVGGGELECESSAEHLASLETPGLCITFMHHAHLFTHITYFHAHEALRGPSTLQEIASRREMYEFGVATRS